MFATRHKDRKKQKEALLHFYTFLYCMFFYGKININTALQRAHIFVIAFKINNGTTEK